MRLRQIFAVRPLALVKIRHGIEPQTIDADPEPEIADFLDSSVHGRIVEVEIRLMRIEPVPVIRLRYRVPRPVRRLEVLKNNPRLLIFLRRIAPYIKIALG